MKNQKYLKLILAVLAIAMLLPGIASAFDAESLTLEIAGEDVTGKGVVLALGDSLSISVTEKPAGADVELDFVSSNTTVATVDGSGNVDSFQKGITVIKVTDKKTGIVVKVNIVVSVLTTDISIDGPTEVNGEKSVQMTYDVQPTGATNKTLNWAVYEDPCTDMTDPEGTCTVSADASVSSKGVVTAGNVTTQTDVVIVACPADGGAECVSHDLKIYPVVSQIDIEKASETVTGTTIYTDFNDSFHLDAVTVADLSETDGDEILWKSSNPSVAYVTPTGGDVDTYEKTGTATITAYSAYNNNIKATVMVRVVKKLTTSIDLSSNPTEVEGGKKVQLKAEVSPSDATNKSLIWMVKDANGCDPSHIDSCYESAFATINTSTGLLTTKAVPDTSEHLLIYVCPVDGGAACADLTIDLLPVIKAAYIMDSNLVPLSSSDTVYIEVGSTEQLDADTDPTGLASGFTWKSASASIADVDASGLVTGNKVGQTTVTVYPDEKPSVKATVKIKVVAKLATDVTITGDTEVEASKSIQLKATVKPTDASVKTVKWAVYEDDGSCDPADVAGTCNPTSDATITSGGKLTGGKVDTDTSVIVIACSTDGAVCKDHSVLVKAVPTGIIIYDDKGDPTTPSTILIVEKGSSLSLPRSVVPKSPRSQDPQ